MTSGKSKTITIIIAVFFLALVLLSGCGGRIPNGGGGTNPVAANLLIRVIDEVTNAPVRNATVSLKKENEQAAPDTATNGNGEATFTNISAGDNYRAFVNNAPGYKSGASSIIKVTGNTESTILLKKMGMGEGSGLIAGSVKDLDSKEALAGMVISYIPPRAQRTAPKPVMTDENGTFVMEGLIPGTYTLNFLKEGYRKTQKSINVAEGQSSNIETLFIPREKSLGSAGNLLVSLNGSSRVVEMDRGGRVVWSYNKLAGIESASRIFTGDTLVADSTGSKILQVSKTGNVINSIGGGTFIKTLKNPSWVDTIDGNAILVTDNGNNSITEYVNGNPVWTYNVALSRPRSAVYLNNGNVLITDTGNRRVIEVTKTGQVVWSFDTDMDKPVHAVRLSDGNTLITDSGFSRIIEVSKARKVVWWYAGNNSGGNGGNSGGADIGMGDGADGLPAPGTGMAGYSPQPVYNVNQNANRTPYNSGYNVYENEKKYRTQSFTGYGSEQPPAPPGGSLLFPRSAVRLPNGNTLIADTGNNRLVEVNKSKQVIWELGNLPRPVAVERL